MSSNLELPSYHTAVYMHFRYYWDENNYERMLLSSDAARMLNADLLPYGGLTVARIYNRNREEVARGLAWCRPDESYVKRLGREISLARALQNLQEGVAPTPPVRARRPRRDPALELALGS